jgi:LPS sulfotransferase NodH
MTRFDYFIVLADMRTGSNYLESNLNALDGVTCFGEAFNPAFVGFPQTGLPFDIDLATREAAPESLLSAIKDADGLGGFRFFRDHDHRVLAICMADPRCAKIILTRNPLDAFVSLKIARATGQWKLTNATHAKKHKVDFDAQEFRDYLEARATYRQQIARALQVTGQGAFYIDYDDLHDLDVMNGLAAFLDVPARLVQLDKKLKKQNPERAADKVANSQAMITALRDFDPFDLDRSPDFEPRKGPGVPGFVAAARTGLMHLPIRSGPEQAVTDWLRALDQAEPITGFSQKSLRDWHQTHDRLRRFTVLAHPVARAHAAFCDRIVSRGKGSFPQLRETLCKVHKLPLPAEVTSVADYDDRAHAAAFTAFLQFLRNNLAGQTGVRVDAAWASQQAILQGMAQIVLPDVILREDEMPTALPALARNLGHANPPDVTLRPHPHQDRLRAIYDPLIEAIAKDAYARDYEAFGFGPWR